MIAKNEATSHPENIFFCNGSTKGDGVITSAHGGDRDSRQLLGATTHHGGKDYCAVPNLNVPESPSPCPTGVSRIDGIREIISNNNRLGRNNSSLSIVSSSISTKSRRLVSKDGIVDIKYKNIPGIKKHYMTDIFHTLIDAKWRYILILFALSFIVSWLIFGTSWFAIVKWDKNHTHRVCIDNVHDWVSAFLFSIEIQTTIGFGGRAVTASCPEGVLLLVIQTIVGMFINCAMLGLLFAKLSRPKNRGKAVLFSNNAVIAIREGSYCLIFRYVDFRPRRLLDSNLRLVIVRQKLTEEGEFVPLDMADMKISLDFMQNDYTLRLFPLFPLMIIHEIDEESPLYKMSRFQLENSEFEIIPILEGTVPTTGSTTQALTSYKPNEILWGHRFKPVFNGLHIGQAVNRIDLSSLHDTYEEKDMPECSAQTYTEDQESEVGQERETIDGYNSCNISYMSKQHTPSNSNRTSFIATGGHDRYRGNGPDVVARGNGPDVVVDLGPVEPYRAKRVEELKESNA